MSEKCPHMFYAVDYPNDRRREYCRLSLGGECVGIGQDGCPNTPKVEQAAKKYKEDALQMEIFKWANENTGIMPELEFMHHIPNGRGKLTGQQAGRLKRLGVRPGVFDIFLPFPRGRYHGLYLELKIKPNKLRASQQIFMGIMADHGYMCEVAYTADEAKEIITRYLTKPECLTMTGYSTREIIKYHKGEKA